MLLLDLVSLISEGLLIGSIQGFILKRYGFPIKSWALAITCSWTLGLMISQKASWYIASSLIDIRGPYWELQFILGHTLFGLFFGAVMGLCLGFILRRDFEQRIVSWVLMNIIAWGVAYFFSEVIIDKIFWAIVGYPMISHDGRFILNNAVLRVSELMIGGAITSIVLFRKFQRPAIRTT